MINRQILTVSATISAKVTGDVGTFDAVFISVTGCHIIYIFS